MKGQKFKDNRRILWNVLRYPETGKPDERMEQLEQKSYHWAYYVLFYAILLTAILDNPMGSADGSTDFYQMVLTGMYLITMLVENGRFLYRCYHGIQNYDGKMGVFQFLFNGLISGFLWLMISISFLGLTDRLNRIIFWSGVLGYFLLCHLAYYRYALFAETDVDDEESGKEEMSLVRKQGKIRVLFLVLVTIYFSAVIAGDCAALVYRSQFPYAPASVKLPKEEQELLLELKKGIERYHALPYVKYECRYETDAEEPSPVYSNGMMAHSYYWVSPEQVYTQILNPEDDTLYQEFYREGMDDWYARYLETWIPEREFWEETPEYQMTEPELRQMQPYTGIQEIEPKNVASITKEQIPEEEEFAGETLYTVTYLESEHNIRERSNFPDNQIPSSIIEHYVLNEFGTLIHYELIESGRIKDSSKRYHEKEMITVLSVKQTEICQEIEERIAQ